MEKTMEKIVALAKSRGFVYPGSEIYGGLANTWDYGNLGVELKNNVKKAWWKKFIQENPYNVGVDCAILMNPQTWVASGHLGGFSDPLMDCKECHERFRADKIIEDYMADNGIEAEGSVDGWTHEQMADYIEEHKIACPTCGKHNFTEIREFNLMFKTFQGVTEDAKNTVYLRPETAQGIFVNFKNVQRTSRKKIPFGIGQVGKSFRNEITPGNFTFRTREFEQMELEFFCEPGTDLEWFQYWRAFCRDWLLSLGIKEDEMRLRDHSPEELCFYSKGTTDIEFLFPFGWGELWGIADRTDYDLTQHQELSKQDLTYFDDDKHERYVPYVIEPSLGADRVTLAFLCAAYDEENIGTERKDLSEVRLDHEHEMEPESSEAEDGKKQTETGKKGAFRGTAYHRALECLDLLAVTDQRKLEGDLLDLFQRGFLTEEAYESIFPWDIWKFLESPLGKRMKQAEKEGKLYRERQFMVGIPASEMGKGLQSEELVLIQGVIDAYIEEADGFILIDYKTDYVPKEDTQKGEELLKERYQVQLDYYGRALTQLTGKKVKEKWIYSFGLRKAIQLG